MSLLGRRFVANAGQFITSRIDARNGAMGLVPKSLDGALVTNDFPLFDLNTERLEPRFLGWLCRTADFIELCRRASEGTTNRVRLKEDRFLACEIPLPLLAEQRRVVARIEEIASQINKIDKKRVERDTVGLLGHFKRCSSICYAHYCSASSPVDGSGNIRFLSTTWNQIVWKGNISQTNSVGS
jgi:hypothetical protein